MSFPGGNPPSVPQQQPGQWQHPGQGQPNSLPSAPVQYAPPAQHPSQPHAVHPQPYGQPPQHFQQPYPQPPQPNPYGQQPLQQPGPYGQPLPFGQQQPYGHQQPYGQPGAPQQNPYGSPQLPDPPGITIDASYMPMAFLLAITKPKILVNGQPVPNTRWGANHIPVGPGQYHVRVSTPWLLDMGPAEVVVPMGAGQAQRFYYRTPAAIFMNGAIGPVPQKTPGMAFVYIMWAFVALIAVLNVAVALS